MSTGPDALVCGAGIGGLTAALALARRGWRVTVLEKQPAAVTIHKGEVLQPRSVQILAELGALARLHAGGALRGARLSCRSAGGRPIVSLDYRTLPDPYNHLLIDYYPRIQAAVEQALPPTVTVRRAAVVTGVLTGGDGRVRGLRVRAGKQREEITAPLTVACDGLGSRLRDEAGLQVAKQRYPHRLLAFELPAPSTPGPGADAAVDLRAFLSARGLRLLYPMPGRGARLYLQAGEDEYRAVGRAGLPEWTARVVAGTPALAPQAPALAAAIDTVQPLQAWRYLAPRWWRPGLALLGDAAHGVHPMAAQGMNMAIADAWALADSLTGCEPDDPARLDAALERYQQVGSRRMAYVSRLSHNLAQLLTDTSWRTRAMLAWITRRNVDNRRLQHILALNMSGLGVRRFTARDRLYQFGLLRDPHGDSVPPFALPADLPARTGGADEALAP